MRICQFLVYTLIGLGGWYSVCSVANSQEVLPAREPGSVVAEIANEGAQVAAMVETPWVQRWLGTASELPHVSPFEIVVNGKTIAVDEHRFYVGRYGSPVAYARALDLAGQSGMQSIENKRVLDFGYGSVGHLRMLALSGAEVVGVDVAPILPQMYADPNDKLGARGVKLVHGSFPSDSEVAQKVDGSYDLILSKNTLKRGYIHPERDAPPAALIHLGVDDATFLDELRQRLRVGGLVVIYNFCPAKAAADQPYIPWADGESPFSRQQFEAAGFEVMAFDVEDHDAARALGSRLGWDQQMKLEQDLFAWYTIAKRKGP